MKHNTQILNRPPVPKLILNSYQTHSGCLESSREFIATYNLPLFTDTTDRRKVLTSRKLISEPYNESTRAEIWAPPFRSARTRSESILKSIQNLDQSKHHDHIPRSQRGSKISKDSNIPGLLVPKYTNDTVTLLKTSQEGSSVYTRLSSATPNKLSRIRSKLIPSPRYSSNFRSSKAISMKSRGYNFLPVQKENFEVREDLFLNEQSKPESSLSRQSLAKTSTSSHTKKQSAVLTLEAIQNSCDYFQLNSSLNKRKITIRDQNIKLAFRKLNCEMEEPELVFDNGYVKNVVDQYIQLKQAEMQTKSYLNKLKTRKHKLT